MCRLQNLEYLDERRTDSLERLKSSDTHNSNIQEVLKTIMYVYVINSNGEPLMPCKPGKARKLLRDGKAKVIQYEPFIIKLKWNCEEGRQPVIAGIDSGSKVIGSAAIANGRVVYQAEIILRNDISGKLTRRAQFRRTRRSRKCRYRHCRFLNRRNSIHKERYAPSIRSKYESHLRERKFMESILPITEWRIELAQFDIHKITNPEVYGKEYQLGAQKGYYNRRQYVLARDGYLCQKCKGKSRKTLRVHHIKYKSDNGMDCVNNLITLCNQCHEDLHNNKFELKAKPDNTKHPTEMGIISSMLRKSDWNFEEEYGYETKYKGERFLKLPKTHYNDAVAICYDKGQDLTLNDTVYYKKHVAKGDYKQTKGAHSQIKLPAGKLFGFRKFDKVESPKGIGFIKGKRRSGSFAISNIEGDIIGHVSYKRLQRLSARSTTLIERRTPHSSPPK